MTAPRGPRSSWLRRLSTPRVMLVMGGFEIVLGLSFLRQPATRGQAWTLLGLGGFLVVAGWLSRRAEVRRRQKPATAPAPARRVTATKPSPTRARGPKAGPKSRLAGPTRYKEPVPLAEPRRLFKRKVAEP